jgi:cysteine desulfurase
LSARNETKNVNPFLCYFGVPMTKPSPVYLDYCASAPLRDRVWEVTSAMLRETGNASSIHYFGRAQRQIIDNARHVISSFLDTKPAQVIFTSGATESNNAALHAFKPQTVIASSIEHPSVLNAAKEAMLIRVSPDGVVDLKHLEELLRTSGQPTLVCLMLVNNETGVVQPVKEAAAICKKYGAKIHCDAVAAMGRMVFSMPDLDVDSLSIWAR